MIYYEQIYDKFHISYFNERGGINLEKITIPEKEKYIWEEVSPDASRKHPKLTSHLGNHVKKTRRNYLDKYRTFEFLNQLPDRLKQRVFSMNTPNKWFMDIETQVIAGLNATEAAQQAKGRVNSNTFCNEQGDVYIQGTKPLTPAQKERLSDRINNYFKDPKNYANGKKPINKEFNVKFKYYEHEATMLADLFYKYVPKMPLITGWNFLKFDWQYLVNRCKNLGVDYTKSSPTGNMYTLVLKDKYDKTKKERIELPAHRGVVDYLAIYEKWDSSIKLKSSYALNQVGLDVLGLQKISYTGTLDDLYETDYETYLYYNAVDTILVQLIDERLGTFNTMMTLANEGHVALHDAAFASVIMESLFSEEFYNGGQVLVKQDYPEDNESYSGGYVEEPGKGKYQNVVIFDYESMFPSIMMWGNTGIDTLLGHTKDEGKTYIDKIGQTHTIDPDKHIWMTSGVVYEKNKDSVMRRTLSKLFDTRVFAKKATGIIDLEIAELEKMLETAPSEVA